MKHEVEDVGTGKMKGRAGVKMSPADQQEMQKKMEAAGTPGPAHKVLDPLTGEWKAEVKCWMEPGSEPKVSAGSAKTKWILNGRFLEEEFHGEMMGKPFTGRTTLGYDNIKQTYNAVWISDMQTSTFISEGKGDNKVITLEGKTDCPASGQKNIPVKLVYRLLSRDKFVFEMFNGSEGEKSMEITYTRK